MDQLSVLIIIAGFYYLNFIAKPNEETGYLDMIGRFFMNYASFLRGINTMASQEDRSIALVIRFMVGHRRCPTLYYYREGRLLALQPCLAFCCAVSAGSLSHRIINSHGFFS